MTTPRIVPLHAAVPPGAVPGAWQALVDRLFVVVAPGEFRGRLWRRGEVVACAGQGEHGDTIALVPRGFGRAQLGSVLGSGLLGDSAEPCSALRWASAGRVVAVFSSGGTGGEAVEGIEVPAGWHVAWAFTGGPAERSPAPRLRRVEPPARPVRARADAAPQLGLFQEPGRASRSAR